jgi:hypothetical protein
MNRFSKFLGIALLTTSSFTAAEILRLESGEKQIPLIELYTSQGCYSCPPAEKWLNKLKDAEGLWQAFVPLALHVDYWDYLGWKDRFADKRNVDRQYKYRSQSLLRAVYTPQVVVDGRDTRRWPTLKSNSFQPGIEAGNLIVSVKKEAANISFTPHRPQEESLRVHLALVAFDINTPVISGENEGRTLAQEFIVLEQTEGVTKAENGSYHWQLDVPRAEHTGRLALAAWVDHPKNNTPLQATGGWYQPPQ